ncbi:hypothetical protein ARMGADRAFT_1019898, partial [Armillaria gallica]
MTLAQSSNPGVIESRFSKVSWSGYVKAKAALKFGLFLSRWYLVESHKPESWDLFSDKFISDIQSQVLTTLVDMTL